MVEITYALFMDNRTPRGAWRRPQLEALGIEWPLVSGWMWRAIGNLVTEEQVEEFKRQRIAPSKQKKAGAAKPARTERDKIMMEYWTARKEATVSDC